MPRTMPQPALFSPIGVALNFALNLLPIALSLSSSLYLSRQAHPENSSNFLKIFALLGQMLLTSAVMINFYRDFDWSGPNNIFTLGGYPKEIDTYHPTELSFEDNALICGRTALVAVAVAAAFSLKHEIIQRYNKEPTDKKAIIRRITIETFGALFGLLAWNIPGWTAFDAYNFGALNFNNYVTMSIAVGFLEGLTQAAFGKLNNSSQSYFSPNFMKKLLVGWFAGALWNVSFVAQDISDLSASMDLDCNFRAFNLALTVAISNGLVSILHTAIDQNTFILDHESLSAFLNQQLGYDALPTSDLDNHDLATRLLAEPAHDKTQEINDDEGLEESKGEGETNPPGEMDAPMKNKNYLFLYTLGTAMTVIGACLPGLSGAAPAYISLALMAMGLGTSSLAHYCAPSSAPLSATVLSPPGHRLLSQKSELELGRSSPKIQVITNP